MAVPFFVLAGAFLTDGGVAKRIINFAVTLVGWMPGGLAMASVSPAPSSPPCPAPVRPR